MIETIGNAPDWLMTPKQVIEHSRRPRSTGKIARLPATVRETINEALTDNIGYPEIVSRLEAMGHPGINTQNISNWFHSGYQSWLRHRERLDLMRLQAEANADLLQQLEAADPSSCNRLNNLYVSAQLAQLMQDFNFDCLKDQLASNPINFFRLVRSIGAQTRNAHREQKLQLELIRSASVPDRSNVEGPCAPALASPSTSPANIENPPTTATEPPAHQAS